MRVDHVLPHVTVDVTGGRGMMQVKLKVLHGLSAGREIVVAAPVFVVGRPVISDLCSNSAFVSRRHCHIRVHDDQVTVLDLGSRNGTFVNGELVKDERVLEMGDVLRIGFIEFEVLIQRSAAWSRYERSLLRSPKDKSSDTDLGAWPTKRLLQLSAESEGPIERADSQMVTTSAHELNEPLSRSEPMSENSSGAVTTRSESCSTGGDRKHS